MGTQKKSNLLTSDSTEKIIFGMTKAAPTVANRPKLNSPATPLSTINGSSSVVKASAPAENAAPTAIADMVMPTTMGPARESSAKG